MARPFPWERYAARPGRSLRRQLRPRPRTSLLPHDSQRFCSTFVLYPVSRNEESMERLGREFLLFKEALDLADRRSRRLARHAERHVRAVELDRLVALVLQPACRAGCDQTVPPRPQGKLGHRRLGGDARDWRLVDFVPGNHLVQPPDIVLFGIARKRRTEGDNRANPVRNCPRQLSREQPTQAPAYDQDRLTVTDLIQPLSQPLDSVGADAQVDAHLPAVNPPPRIGERPPA